MIIEWFAANYFEVIGALLGILYVILASRQSVWCWIAGNINVAMYILIFFNARLYGDMALQMLYFIMGIYGWWQWMFAKSNGAQKLSIRKIKTPLLLLSMLIAVIMAGLFGYILTFTNTDVPWLDGVATSFGIWGTWLTARKYIENWLVWVVANAYCAGLFYYKNLYPTVVFYIIMLVLAIYAYYIWKRQMKPATN